MALVRGLHIELGALDGDRVLTEPCCGFDCRRSAGGDASIAWRCSCHIVLPNARHLHAGGGRVPWRRSPTGIAQTSPCHLHAGNGSMS